MARRFRRNSLVRKNVRRVNEVNTRRINKRKYYGVGTEQKEMKESLEYHFTHTSVIDSLNDSLAGVESFDNTNSEALADDIVSGTNFLRSGVESAVDAVREPLGNSFEKGTRRAFDSTGDTLPAPDDIGEQVNDIVQEQRNYISQLNQDLGNKARELIRDGLEAGKSKTQIIQDLRQGLKNLVDNRTDTISESETVKAAGEGTEATFDYNGVSKVEWVAEIDESTCESGAFRVTYNGTTYSSCRELDGAEFDRTGNHPVPVESSHPNCRCLLVAVDE